MTYLEKEIQEIKDRIAKLEANLDYTNYDFEAGESVSTTYGDQTISKKRQEVSRETA